MKTLLLILLSATAAFGQGTILWNEAINGPLANLAGSATPLGSFQVGTNTVIGSAEVIPTGGGWLGNNDYFTFSVPASLQVSQVNFSVDTLSWAWIGDGAYSAQYGFAIHPSNGDLLPQWVISVLSPGTYGMYISDDNLQTFPTAANYRLDFFVQAIPEPGTFWLVVAGAGLVGLRGWRKAQRVRGAR